MEKHGSIAPSIAVQCGERVDILQRLVYAKRVDPFRSGTSSSDVPIEAKRGGYR